MAQQIEFPFASLDFPGRVNLGVEEIAKKLGLSARHIVGLIEEGKIRAQDHRGLDASRATYRISVEDYRDYIVRSLTSPADKLGLLRDLPIATLIELQRELNRLIGARSISGGAAATKSPHAA